MNLLTKEVQCQNVTFAYYIQNSAHQCRSHNTARQIWRLSKMSTLILNICTNGNTGSNACQRHRNKTKLQVSSIITKIEINVKRVQELRVNEWEKQLIKKYHHHHHLSPNNGAYCVVICSIRYSYHNFKFARAVCHS